jgi:hypothetical protein
MAQKSLTGKSIQSPCVELVLMLVWGVGRPREDAAAWVTPTARIEGFRNEMRVSGRIRLFIIAMDANDTGLLTATVIYTIFHSIKGAITVRDQPILHVHNAETGPCAITCVLVFDEIGCLDPREPHIEAESVS